MNSIIEEFNEKAQEIDEYLFFIGTTTFLKRDFDKDKIKVSQKVHNILKANLFLLLYKIKNKINNTFFRKS